jgi:hypothetical protein
LADALDGVDVALVEVDSGNFYPSVPGLLVNLKTDARADCRLQEIEAEFYQKLERIDQEFYPVPSAG